MKVFASIIAGIAFASGSVLLTFAITGAIDEQRQLPARIYGVQEVALLVFQTIIVGIVVSFAAYMQIKSFTK